MIKEYTYKYRIYPTLEQEIMFSKIFGCVRFVYNYFLDDYKKINIEVNMKKIIFVTEN